MCILCFVLLNNNSYYILCVCHHSQTLHRRQHKNKTILRKIKMRNSITSHKFYNNLSSSAKIRKNLPFFFSFPPSPSFIIFMSFQLETSHKLIKCSSSSLEFVNCHCIQCRYMFHLNESETKNNKVLNATAGLIQPNDAIWIKISFWSRDISADASLIFYNSPCHLIVFRKRKSSRKNRDILIKRHHRLG